MFIPVILTKSERRRSEGAWKDHEDFSLSILDQGVLTIPRPLSGMDPSSWFSYTQLFSHAADAQIQSFRSETSVRARVYSCRYLGLEQF
jgi:hypothetical protein